MNYKYRIVCNIDDTWFVQERTPEGDWMSIHHCELKAVQQPAPAPAPQKRKAVQTSIVIVPPMPDDDPTADLPF